MPRLDELLLVHGTVQPYAPCAVCGSLVLMSLAEQHYRQLHPAHLDSAVLRGL